MQVAILHNELPPDASAAEQDVLVQVEAVARSLDRLGHQSTAVAVNLDLGSLAGQLERLRPDAAFNLVESLGGSDRLMFLPAALLDVRGIPYTGSPTEAIVLSGDKPAAKRRLTEAGLPTPDWLDEGGFGVQGSGSRVQGSVPSADGGPSTLNPQPSTFVPGRFIIKPAWEHASAGLDGSSVVKVADAGELAELVAERAARSGRPCFAERFIEGREFNLSLLASPTGPEVLPPAEIDFSAFGEGEPRIVGYRAKWDEESFEYLNTSRTFDFAATDGSLVDELRKLAAACWPLFGLRGYARVDFRVDLAGRPWILEINANPCLSPDAGFAAAVERASIGFDRAVERILDDAVSDRS